MNRKEKKDMPSFMLTAESALKDARKRLSPFLYLSRKNEEKRRGVLGLLVIENDRSGYKRIEKVARISWKSYPPEIKGYGRGEGWALFAALVSAPRCPSCSSRLLTKSEFVDTVGADGLEALSGILDSNRYCPIDWEKHPFWCEYHKAVHAKRCEHDYSDVEHKGSGYCKICGDPISNAAEMAREIRRGG